MKRTRIAAMFILLAALVAVSTGTASAQSEASDRVAVELPGLVCEGLDDLLSQNGIVDVDGASITVEIVPPARPLDPIELWRLTSRPSSALFTCDASSTTRVPSDVATAP